MGGPLTQVMVVQTEETIKMFRIGTLGNKMI